MLLNMRKRVLYFCLFVLLIHASNSVRNYTKLHCHEVLLPFESLWAKLYHHGDSLSFLTMTGMTRHAFTILHDVRATSKNRQTSADESHCSIRSFPFLYWEYHGIQAFMLVFWMYPYSMHQSSQQDVEVSSKEVKKESISLC